MTIKLNDSVIINSEVTDPDFGIVIGGWQGRISEINEEVICVDWDSITLKNLEASIITRSEKEGLDWTKMYVLSDEVTLTKPRDQKRDVKKVINELNSKYAWLGLGEEGVRIQKVLSGIKLEDYNSALWAWKEHLDKKLNFPIKAEVVELMERGSLRVGEQVIIYGIDEFVDEMRGLFAKVEYQNSKGFEFPLADLEVLDKKSQNFQHIKDYVVWYANR